MGTSSAPHGLTSTEVRQSFLDFFKARDHVIVPSIPLVPGGDETLLFTNSGMVQFKDVFLGTGQRPYSRVADSQKCLRVAGKHNDLDDVGRDDIHHTFFEMLGNWSFGDYYKDEAIAWAWELLSEAWGLPKANLWATCFEDEAGQIPRDDQAAAAWARQPGFDSAHIAFFGRKDNFWEMADTGPCGPDSEVHIDRGQEYCTKQGTPGHVCRINGDCGRFVELWNLVFIQYNRTSPTRLDPLPKVHVDTGMGFDRIVSVLQGVGSNYRTDQFAPILEATRRLAGHRPEDMEAHWTPYRVIADHARAAAFLIGDGVVPGNLGRNYVTRMIIRRAALFGTKLGLTEPFLAEVTEAVVRQYGDAYPELEQHHQAIRRLVTEEEQRFARTIQSGVGRLRERLSELEQQGANQLPGDWAFDLYATYGLPLEITQDLARERGIEPDVAAFYAAMDRHRELSAGDPQIGGAGVEPAELTGRYQSVLDGLRQRNQLGPGGVAYDPYSGLSTEGPLLALLKEGAPVEEAHPGDRVAAVLPSTAFYLEAGGQVADTGLIRSADSAGWEIEVHDVREPVDGLVVHLGVVADGEPRVGDPATATVDAVRRADIMRNHTATHLLHAALRQVLGGHARQAGSLVAPDRLRFDFNHPNAMTPEEIEQVERLVNEHVLSNFPVQVVHQAREEAIRQGAMALFGEAYGATVRTIQIGEPERISYELCGGTHLAETGVIGTFLITSESSVAAGIRRIEAVTGRGALELIREQTRTLRQLAAQLEATPAEAVDRVAGLLGDRQRLLRELDRVRGSQAVEHFQRLSPQAVDGVPVLAGLIPNANADSLRALVDRFRSDHPSGVAVLASTLDNRPIIIAAVTQDLVARGLHAGELVKAVAELVGGGGGGKPTLAQAGGKDPTRLPAALASVPAWVERHLK
jgi:alanyl-tRNA synthetase